MTTNADEQMSLWFAALLYGSIEGKVFKLILSVFGSDYFTWLSKMSQSGDLNATKFAVV